MALGLLMPWATVGPFSIDEIDTDDGKVFGVVVGGVAAAFAVYEIGWGIEDPSGFIDVTPGAGLFGFVGAAVFFAGALYQIRYARLGSP